MKVTLELNGMLLNINVSQFSNDVCALSLYHARLYLFIHFVLDFISGLFVYSFFVLK